MNGTVRGDVGVGEGGEVTRETTKDDENKDEDFVDGLAVAAVGEDGAEELEEEDGAGGEETD